MKLLKRIFTIIMLSLVAAGCQPEVEIKPIHIIPQPKSIVEMDERPFVIRKGARIQIEDESMLIAATSLISVLKRDIPIDIVGDTQTGKGNIVFIYDNDLDLDS